MRPSVSRQHMVFHHNSHILHDLQQKWWFWIPSLVRINNGVLFYFEYFGYCYKGEDLCYKLIFKFNSSGLEFWRESIFRKIHIHRIAKPFVKFRFSLCNYVLESEWTLSALNKILPLEWYVSLQYLLTGEMKASICKYIEIIMITWLHGFENLVWK